MSTSEPASKVSRSSPGTDAYSQLSSLARLHSKPARRDRLTKILAAMAAAEFVFVAGTAYLASVVYNRAVLMRPPPTDEYVPSALFIAAVITLASLGFRHFAAIQSESRRRFIWRGISVVVLTFSLFLSAMFVLKVANLYSRGTFLAQLVTVMAAVAVFRLVALNLVRSAIVRGYLEASRIVLVGDDALYAPILKYLSDQGIQTAGSFPFPARHTEASSGVDDEIDRQKVRQLVNECRTLAPDDILILPADAHLNRAAELAVLLSVLPVSIHLLPLAAMDFLPTARIGALGTQLTFELVPRPLSIFDRFLKRTFDVAAAAASLLLLSPLFLIIAAAIKLDSRGPVFFRQTRHGYNNEPIRVFKFRSMTMTEDGDAFTQAAKADPRVTRVGKVLRRTNADELPQLLNVLSGEMSIVGPRPHPIALNEQYRYHIGPFMRRHNVKPGITGWAQVHGCRGETDTLEKMQRRLEYDLYYLENWSFLFDMQIIVLTLLSPKAYTNAY